MGQIAHLRNKTWQKQTRAKLSLYQHCLHCHHYLSRMEWSFTEICFVPSLVEIATGSSAHFIFALALSPKSMVGELKAERTFAQQLFTSRTVKQNSMKMQYLP